MDIFMEMVKYDIGISIIHDKTEEAKKITLEKQGGVSGAELVSLVMNVSTLRQISNQEMMAEIYTGLMTQKLLMEHINNLRIAK